MRRTPSGSRISALRVAFFNAYKLRTQNVALQDQWMMLVAVLATFDVVCLTEVPAPPSPPPPQSEAPSDSAKGCCSKSDDGQKRIDAFLKMSACPYLIAQGLLQGLPAADVFAGGCSDLMFDGLHR